MNKSLHSRSIIIACIFSSIGLIASRAEAVEALLLQDTYVDNGTNGGKAAPNNSNYGAAMDLRVFKGNGRLGRSFLKFSFETLPSETTAEYVVQARLRLWINGNTTAVGAIILKSVTSEWDEYTLTGDSADNVTAGAPLQNFVIETVNNFVSIDVTQWTKARLDSNLVNHGLVIEPALETDFVDLLFDSKESIHTSHKARLAITLLNQR